MNLAIDGIPFPSWEPVRPRLDCMPFEIILRIAELLRPIHAVSSCTFSYRRRDEDAVSSRGQYVSCRKQRSERRVGWRLHDAPWIYHQDVMMDQCSGGIWSIFSTLDHQEERESGHDVARLARAHCNFTAACEKVLYQRLEIGESERLAKTLEAKPHVQKHLKRATLLVSDTNLRYARDLSPISQALDYIIDCANLQSLQVHRWPLQKQALSEVLRTASKLPALRSLGLCSFQICPSDSSSFVVVPQVRELAMEWVDTLSNNSPSQEAMLLKCFPGLQTLSLVECKLSSAALFEACRDSLTTLSWTDHRPNALSRDALQGVTNLKHIKCPTIRHALAVTANPAGLAIHLPPTLETIEFHSVAGGLRDENCLLAHWVTGRAVWFEYLLEDLEAWCKGQPALRVVDVRCIEPIFYGKDFNLFKEAGQCLEAAKKRFEELGLILLCEDFSDEVFVEMQKSLSLNGRYQLMADEQAM
ncbi:hypothetical protein CTRI78_v009558 [Colletotrichum trifolii]|uniref:F-box domain-containing protein n=1 Tax=Colletotrichum trifolii TaxID=5466 RepID=A0A4R8QS77_COLTR|nr:hypothetical protein CTRI78_v009558 [Colletotrichum trifolii]